MLTSAVLTLSQTRVVIIITLTGVRKTLHSWKYHNNNEQNQIIELEIHYTFQLHERYFLSVEKNVMNDWAL